jgi:hypothetical protein
MTQWFLVNGLVIVAWDVAVALMKKLGRGRRFVFASAAGRFGVLVLALLLVNWPQFDIPAR